jgi:hypothetical protein
MNATVEDQLEHILRQLNRKVLVPWVTEMQLGKPVYDFLLSAVQRPLTKHQRANLLVALYRLKGHGRMRICFRHSLIMRLTRIRGFVARLFLCLSD